MRILKYILLIFLLLFVGFSVFVSTQSADFNLVKSKIIKSSRVTVFNYVNDFNNWNSFISLNTSSKKYNFSTITSGKGAIIDWSSLSESGKIKNISVVENGVINQVKVLNGSKSTTKWEFKDTLGVTKVTMKSLGKVDFKTKVLSFFSGGVSNDVGNQMELDLENLSRTLNVEMNEFNIKLNGVVKQDSTYYLKKSVHCYEKSVRKNSKIMFVQLQKYFEDNNITPSGKPFLIYEKQNADIDLISLSVAFPVKDSIITKPKSGVYFSYLEKYTAVKTTLKGDYSHLKKAWDATDAYFIKNNLIKNKLGRVIEIYKIDNSSERSHSKWVTEIYVPMFVKPAYKRVPRPEGDTTREPGDIVPSKTNEIPEEFDL